VVRYDVANGKRTELKGSAPSRRGWPENRSPDGKRVLYSHRGNLYVHDLETDQRTALTKTQHNESIHNGRATWSPDGKRIAFVQSDSSKVRRRAMLVPSDPSYPQVRMVRFTRVGEPITALRVGVVEAGGGETQWLIPASSEGYYLGQVSWAGNSNELLVEKLSRFRDEREFLLADVRTGKLKRIFHESDPAWVVASYGKNSGLKWIRDGNAFIVLSEKDGWRRAYVYSRSGEEQTVLTPSGTDIIERSVVDEAGEWFYYYASPDNATQKYLYRTRLDGTGEPERVTPQEQPGTHNYNFSPDAQWAFHTFSRFDTPPITELVKLADHSVIRVLEDNQKLREKMETISAPPTEFLQLKIDDVIVDAWMMKPTDFDPSRKYPLFVYVYGEPHAQTVLDRWGTSHADFHRLLAELGYLVVSIDNRGTPAPKGAAWRRAVFGSLGPLSTREQAAAVKELGRERSYVDLSRVGVWGWSGGGSNTLNAMFREPDVFHVGIAVAPKTSSLQCFVPGNLHGDTRDESGWLSPRGPNQLCRGPEGRSVDCSRNRRDQHAYSNHRGTRRSFDRTRQTIRLHGLP
jgi:dipeptidyl-peptidase-4